ncbi:MAG TPA: hypothetical protein PLM71_11090 [Syntrophorhabdaceae bacterium]|nr:hypothetical protein [Syntrophorhabdaceae bacterium]
MEAPIKIQTLADLAPNLPLQQVLSGLIEKGIKGGIEEGNNIIFETVWFPEITQRQRLVLTKKVNRLEKATLIIDLQQVGEHETLRELYGRIQAMLSRTFGSAVTREKGVFGPNIAAELRNGNFIGTSDWSTPTGILRLGIPYRLDGIVRIEIQHAESFPLSTHVNWGLEEVK